MHDAGRVRGGEPVCHLGHQRRRLGGRKAAAPRPAQPVQVAAGDQLHDQGELVTFHDHVVHGHHVRVTKRDQDGALADEPPDGRRVARVLRPHDLDRVHGPGRPVVAAPDDAHTAPADLLVKEVLASEGLCSHRAG